MLRRFLLWILRDDLVTAPRLLEIEEEWTGVLQRMAAAAAREGKAAKRQLKKATEAETQLPVTPAQPIDRKAALRKRAAAVVGMGRFGAQDFPTTQGENDVAGSQDG